MDAKAVAGTEMKSRLSGCHGSVANRQQGEIVMGARGVDPHYTDLMGCGTLSARHALESDGGGCPRTSTGFHLTFDFDEDEARAVHR
jgi:hypothetical protein